MVCQIDPHFSSYVVLLNDEIGVSSLRLCCHLLGLVCGECCFSGRISRVGLIKAKGFLAAKSGSWPLGWDVSGGLGWGYGLQARNTRMCLLECQLVKFTGCELQHVERAYMLSSLRIFESYARGWSGGDVTSWLGARSKQTATLFWRGVKGTQISWQ